MPQSSALSKPEAPLTSLPERDEADVSRPESDADRIRADPNVWSRLTGRPAAAPLQASNVQFALLQEEAKRQGRSLRLMIRDKSITIRI